MTPNPVVLRRCAVPTWRRGAPDSCTEFGLQAAPKTDHSHVRTASTSGDETVRLWDAASGQLLATLKGHNGAVNAVAISQDGRLVASGGDDGIVRLWDADSGVCLRTLSPDRYYERLDITGLTGVTDAQRAARAWRSPDSSTRPPCSTTDADRGRHPHRATRGRGAALDRFSTSTQAAGTDWALGMEAAARAIVSADGAAESHFREAIERFGRTRIAVQLARAHLLYGEWLRRKRRRVDARQHLRLASEMLVTMGADGFAERAARELAATGETARKRSVETIDQLTPRELHIARLARDGRSNAEIGAQLFISPRTVEYHLASVFAKLSIASRLQLERALPEARTTSGDSPGAT